MNSSLKLFFPTEEKKNLCAPPNPKLYIALNLICWRWTERNAPIRTDIEQKASSSEAGTPMQDKESCIKYFLEKRHLKKLVQLSPYTVYSKVGFWSTLVYVLSCRGDWYWNCINCLRRHTEVSLQIGYRSYTSIFSIFYDLSRGFSFEWFAPFCVLHYIDLLYMSKGTYAPLLYSCI